MIDYHEAILQMYQGNVVKYIGTVNGNVMTENGLSFCMQRGVIFVYTPENIDYKTCGHMVYDPDFRYILTGETVEPRGWPNREREVKGYSRIGLNNA